MSVSSHHFGTLTLAIIIWRLITPRRRRSRIPSSQLQIRISTASVQSAVNQWTSKPADWCYDSMPDQTNSFPVNFVRVNIPQFRFSFRLQLISLIYVRQLDQHSNYRIFVQASRYTVPTLVSCPQAFLHLPYIGYVRLDKAISELQRGSIPGFRGMTGKLIRKYSVQV